MMRNRLFAPNYNLKQEYFEFLYLRGILRHIHIEQVPKTK